MGAELRNGGNYLLFPRSTFFCRRRPRDAIVGVWLCVGMRAVRHFVAAAAAGVRRSTDCRPVAEQSSVYVFNCVLRHTTFAGTTLLQNWEQ